MCVALIKEKLSGDKNLVIYILEELGCHKITSRHDEVRCALPDGTTPTSVRVVVNEFMYCTVFSRSDYDGTDIISLVQYVKEIKFIDTVKWLCKKLEIPFENYEPPPEDEDYSLYKMLKKETRRHIRRREIKHSVLNENVLDRYLKTPVQEWIDEGINYETQQRHRIRIDNYGKRIIIPIYDSKGNLINLKGRTTVANFDELNIPKYIYYYELGTNDFFWGLHLEDHIRAIKEQNEIIIFESAKSVMKSEEHGIYNTASIEAGNINVAHQLPLILALHCNVILAFDKDKTFKEVMIEAGYFKNYTNVSFIYDKSNLLTGKDSPIDKGKDIFMKLYENRIEVY